MSAMWTNAKTSSAIYSPASNREDHLKRKESSKSMTDLQQHPYTITNTLYSSNKTSSYINTNNSGDNDNGNGSNLNINVNNTNSSNNTNNVTTSPTTNGSTTHINSSYNLSNGRSHSPKQQREASSTININNNNTSPSTATRPPMRRDPSNTTNHIISGMNASSNYKYPVVNVKQVHQQTSENNTNTNSNHSNTPNSSLNVNTNNVNNNNATANNSNTNVANSNDSSNNKETEKEKEKGKEGGGGAEASSEATDDMKAQRRLQLRTQRDNLAWEWNANGNSHQNHHAKEDGMGGEGGPPSSTLQKLTLASSSSKRTDVEGLMSKAWDKQYKEGVLFVSISESQLNNTTRSLPGTIISIKMQKKVVSSSPYGQDFYLEIGEKPMYDLTVQVHSINRLNKKKKMGKCTVVLSKLEDGKTLEQWYSFVKKKRKTTKSKGYLKIKVSYTSAVTRNKDYMMAKENYDQITTLLFDKEGVIVCTLCKLDKEEDLSMALIRLFNTQKQASMLLVNLMIREIYASDDPSTLFRRDSMATKTARNFFSIVAKSYLKKFILPFIAFISYDVSKGNSYEVDPSKLKSSDEITSNAARLITAAKKFLSPILDSCMHLPLTVRMFFCHLSALLQSRAKTGNPAGAFFFLRFVCPAILFPSQYDLMDKPLDTSISRALVLVTKILQNLVNGCLFHEEYMTIFNSFITDNIGQVNVFLEALCTPPPPSYPTQDDPLPPYSDEQLVKLLSIIVRKLHISFDKLETQIELDPLFLTSRDKEYQRYLYAQLKTLFLERILTSPSGDESEMKRT